MTHKDAGHYAAKHPPNAKCNPQIAEALKKKVVDNKITCVAAHKIAHKLKVTPAEVGLTIDLLENRISKCQLGLFGYSPQKRIVKPAESVSPQLREAIKKALVNNRISCKSCWDIAPKFGIAKINVSAVCEALKVKICSCRLGAFG